MNWEKEVKKMEKEFDTQIKEENLKKLAKVFAKVMKNSLEELEKAGFDEDECIKLAIQNWMVHLMVYKNEGEFPHDF